MTPKTVVDARAGVHAARRAESAARAKAAASPRSELAQRRLDRCIVLLRRAEWEWQRVDAVIESSFELMAHIEGKQP